MPPEKKKKGKRKSDVLQEAPESDETASLCALAPGNEESSDTLDGTVRLPAGGRCTLIYRFIQLESLLFINGATSVLISLLAILRMLYFNGLLTVPRRNVAPGGK